MIGAASRQRRPFSNGPSVVFTSGSIALDRPQEVKSNGNCRVSLPKLGGSGLTQHANQHAENLFAQQVEAVDVPVTSLRLWFDPSLPALCIHTYTKNPYLGIRLAAQCCVQSHPVALQWNGRRPAFLHQFRPSQLRMSVCSIMWLFCLADRQYRRSTHNQPLLFQHPL